MEDLTLNLTPEVLALIPIVAAILQVVKGISAVNKLKQWFPFFGIAIAYGLGLASGATDPVIQSVLVGLVAAGSYDLFKAKK